MARAFTPAKYTRKTREKHALRRCVIKRPREFVKAQSPDERGRYGAGDNAWRFKKYKGNYEYPKGGRDRNVLVYHSSFEDTSELRDESAETLFNTMCSFGKFDQVPNSIRFTKFV